MITRRIANEWTPVGFVRKWDGTNWVDVSFVRKWNGSAWVQVWPVTSDFAVTVSSTTVTTEFVCDAAVDISCPFITAIVSPVVTVVAEGGSGAGPTYLWEYVSGSTGITVSNSSASAVTFSGVVGRRQSLSAVWKCTVTRGTETKSVQVLVNLWYTYVNTGEELP